MEVVPRSAPHWLTVFFVAVTWIFVTSYISDKAATLAAHRGYDANQQCGQRHLSDQMLDILPDWSGSQLANGIVVVYVASMLIYIGGPDPKGVLYRWAILFGLLLLMRSLTIVSVAYPAPDEPGEGCMVMKIPWRWWGSSLLAWLPTCGDYMFSGHTMNFVLASCVHTVQLNTLDPFRTRPSLCLCMLAAVWVGCACGMLSLLLVRLHYTTDVLVGAYVAGSLFALHERIPAELPDRMWVWWMFGRNGTQCSDSDCLSEHAQLSLQMSRDDVRQ